jgi:hypothetical protein
VCHQFGIFNLTHDPPSPRVCIFVTPVCCADLKPTNEPPPPPPEALGISRNSAFAESDDLDDGPAAGYGMLRSTRTTADDLRTPAARRGSAISPSVAASPRAGAGARAPVASRGAASTSSTDRRNSNPESQARPTTARKPATPVAPAVASARPTSMSIKKPLVSARGTPATSRPVQEPRAVASTARGSAAVTSTAAKKEEDIAR